MQNELTPNELTHNELIMLDALAYYKQLSDDYIPNEVNGKIGYQKLENFINVALNNEDYKTCFNELISDESSTDDNPEYFNTNEYINKELNK